MSTIRCGKCGFQVAGTDHLNLKLMTDIRRWINYVLSVHVAHGETARHLNASADCPPCPQCQAMGTWVNVV